MNIKVCFCFIMTDESESLNKNSQTGNQHHGSGKPILVHFCFLPLAPSECCSDLSFAWLYPHACLRRLKSPDSWAAAKRGFLLSLRERLFTICTLKHFVQSVDFMAIKKIRQLKSKRSTVCLFSVYKRTNCSARYQNKSVKVQFISPCNYRKVWCDVGNNTESRCLMKEHDSGVCVKIYRLHLLG